MWILVKPVENIKVSDFCPNRGSIDSIHWAIYRFFIMSYMQTSDLPVSSSCARHPWDRGRLRCAVFDSKTVGLQVWIFWNCGTLRNKKSGQIDAQLGKKWCDWWLFFPNRRRLVINICRMFRPWRSALRAPVFTMWQTNPMDSAILGTFQKYFG